jgi:hypothetical protein
MESVSNNLNLVKVVILHPEFSYSFPRLKKSVY